MSLHVLESELHDLETQLHVLEITLLVPERPLTSRKTPNVLKIFLVRAWVAGGE